MKITITGLDRLDRILQNMPGVAKVAGRMELQRACLDLKGKAQRITPVETGDLQGSAYYRTELTPEGAIAEVGFTAPYATRQHEELGYRHKSPGQAKYLETSLKDNIDKYVNKIGDTIKKAVEINERTF